MMPSRNENRTAACLELAGLFLKLGTVAFGGPAAHIAMMRSEVVQRRGWMSETAFLDLLGATNLIPGPNSTEMAIHIGYQHAGWPGLLVAGACFIVPAVGIVLGLSWLYVTYGALPVVTGMLYALKPVIMVIVLHALLPLSKTAFKSPGLIGLSLVAALLAGFSQTSEALLILGCGAGWLLFKHWRMGKTPQWPLSLGAFPFLNTLPLASALPANTTATTLGAWPLFWFFAKTGSVLFGSGYVLLAFLQSELVDRFGWLTQQQLLDAVIVGQVTPGPVFTTATFIGYILLGPSGALWATLGIFSPAFVFVALSAPWVPRLRESPQAAHFLDGVNAAAIALMGVVLLQLLPAAVVDLPTVLIAVISFILLQALQVSPTWLCLLAAGVGLFVSVKG